MLRKDWLLHIFLVMLFFTESSSQECSQSRGKLEESNEANLELLNKKMGSTIPLKCIDDVMSFTSKASEEDFRKISNLQAENATVAIQEILQEIRQIFNENHTEMAWDRNSMAIFKAGLDKEIENLQPCLSAGDYIDIIPIVQNYFQRIKDLLKDKKYNMCAWEIAQMEVRECFLMAGRLIQRMHNQAPAVIAEVSNDTASDQCTLPSDQSLKAKQEK